MAIRVVASRCPQNHPCPAVRVCPAGALSQKGYAAPLVDADACTECQACVDFCPGGALTLAPPAMRQHGVQQGWQN